MRTLAVQLIRGDLGVGASATGTVTYREDESRIREKQLRENMAWMNRHTLSLLKQQTNKKSVAMNRRRCGWNDDVLLKILTATQS